MTKIIGFALAMGFALLEAGKPREATYYMAKRAAYSMQHDMISLVELNRALQSGGKAPKKVKKSKHHPNSR